VNFPRSALLSVVAAAALMLPAAMTSAPALAQSAPQAAVQPEALQALQRMSAYLGTLRSFRVVADTTADRVYDNGQTLEFGGRVTYDVRRPNGFVIEIASDRNVRKVYYDGKSITLFAPARSLYASAPAPATIAETLDAAWERHGISIPLQDLFRWSDPNEGREETLMTGIHVGYARVNGVECDQYAFQEGSVDWQVWIARGERPVPVRVVITDASDLAHPKYTANLTWTENPTYSDATFAFQPPSGAERISIAEAGK